MTSTLIFPHIAAVPMDSPSDIFMEEFKRTRIIYEGFFNMWLRYEWVFVALDAIRCKAKLSEPAIERLRFRFNGPDGRSFIIEDIYCTDSCTIAYFSEGNVYLGDYDVRQEEIASWVVARCMGQEPTQRRRLRPGEEQGGRWWPQADERRPRVCTSCTLL